MVKKQVKIFLDDKTYKEINLYKERLEIASLSASAVRLIQLGLNAEKEKTQKQNEVDKISKEVSKCINEKLLDTSKAIKSLESSLYVIRKNSSKTSSASLGSLTLLSFIYRDLCALFSKKLGITDSRYHYWSKQETEDIFRFFKSVGGSMTSMERISFIPSFKNTASKMPFSEASSDDLVGINPDEFASKANRLTSGTNENISDEVNNQDTHESQQKQHPQQTLKTKQSHSQQPSAQKNRTKQYKKKSKSKRNQNNKRM